MNTAMNIYRESEAGTEKRCSKCQIYFPADNDHFYNDSSATGGLSSQCKSCQLGKSWDEIRSGSKSQPDVLRSADFMQDPQGRLVPVDMVKELEKSRDELVRRLIADGKAVRDEMAAFKRIAMDEVRAFIDLAAQEWEVSLGGQKGNVTLHSFDGCLKIQIQVAERFVFDEQLQVAKKMIDECLMEWSQDSRDEIKTIITDAFQVDKEGKINIRRVLDLRRHDIKDPLWLKAMEAIAASLRVIGSKEYIRLYERPSSKDPWQPISLDMAGI